MTSKSKVVDMTIKLLKSEVEMKKYLSWCKTSKMIVEPIIWAAHFGCKKRMGVLIRYFEKKLKHQRETYLNDKRMILQRTYNQLRIPSKLGLIDRSFLRKNQIYKKYYVHFAPIPKEPKWMKCEEYFFYDDNDTLRTYYLAKMLGSVTEDSDETDSDDVEGKIMDKNYFHKIWKCKNKNRKNLIEWNSSTDSNGSRSDFEENVSLEGSGCSRLDGSRSPQYDLTSPPMVADCLYQEYTEDENGDGRSMMIEKDVEDMDVNIAQSEDIGYESSSFMRPITTQEEVNKVILEDASIPCTEESGTLYTSEMEIEETADVAQILEAESERSFNSIPEGSDVFYAGTSLDNDGQWSSTSSQEQDNNEESTSTSLPLISEPTILSTANNDADLIGTNRNRESSENEVSDIQPLLENATPFQLYPAEKDTLRYPTINDNTKLPNKGAAQRFTNDDIATLLLENMKFTNESRPRVMTSRKQKGQKRENKRKNELLVKTTQTSIRNKILKNPYREGKSQQGKSCGTKRKESSNDPGADVSSIEESERESSTT